MAATQARLPDGGAVVHWERRTVVVTRSDGVQARADIDEATNDVWSHHSARVSEITARLRRRLEDSLPPALCEDVLDEVVFGTLNSFQFERIAAWLVADQLRNELNLSTSTPLAGLDAFPSEVPAKAFAAGWRDGDGDGDGDGDIRSDQFASTFAAGAGLLISLLSAPSAIWLKALRRLPAGVDMVVVTPSAPTNQARHGLELAQREAGLGRVSGVVVLGHGLFGPGRGRAFRKLCPDALRVTPWSFGDLFAIAPATFRQAMIVQGAAKAFYDMVGFPLKFRARIDLCARLVRGEVFSRWARRQSWPRTVSFSIAGRLDRTMADRALQGMGVRTAHLIHGLHAAGNAWSYRARSTVGVTLLESEANFREVHGRYARVIPLSAIAGRCNEPPTASNPAPMAASGPLLLCTNMLHLFSPWFARNAEGRHLDLFTACQVWARAWECDAVIWRAHPAGRAQAPARLAELERRAREIGIIVDEEALGSSVAKARIIVTTPSGVVSDVANLGKTALVLQGILKDQTPPWTEIPPSLWLDPDQPETHLNFDAIREAVEDPDIFQTVQTKFSTPGWGSLSATKLDAALWEERPPLTAGPLPRNASGA